MAEKNEEVVQEQARDISFRKDAVGVVNQLRAGLYVSIGAHNTLVKPVFASSPTHTHVCCIRPDFKRSCHV